MTRDLESATTETSPNGKIYTATPTITGCDSGSYSTHVARSFTFGGTDYSVVTASGDPTYTPAVSGITTSNVGEFCMAACDAISDCTGFEVSSTDCKFATACATLDSTSATTTVYQKSTKMQPSALVESFANNYVVDVGFKCGSPTYPSAVSANTAAGNLNTVATTFATSDTTGVVSLDQSGGKTFANIGGSPAIANLEQRASVCAIICDKTPGCNFAIANENTAPVDSLAASSCIVYATCTIEKSTDGNAGKIALVSKASATDLPFTYLSPTAQLKVTSNKKCDGSVTALASAGVSVTINGDSYTVKTGSNGELNFGSNITPPQNELSAWCYEACRQIDADTDSASICKGVTSYAPTSKCFAYQTCGAPAYPHSSNDDRYALIEKSRDHVATASKGYMVHKLMNCGTAHYVTELKETSAASVSHESIDYKVYTDASGVMQFQKSGADVTWANIQSEGTFATGVDGDQYALCAKACDVIPECEKVVVTTDTECVAHKSTCVEGVGSKFLMKAAGFPTNAPTKAPTKNPSATPSSGPSSTPTAAPSSGPSNSPSLGPSNGPTKGPSPAPSAPTVAPSSGPSRGPAVPTDAPSGPTNNPSPRPSQPTENPTPKPTQPTPFPSRPTKMPVKKPTPAPTHPTPAPTRPTPAPTAPTPAPTVATAGESNVDTTSASSTIMALQVVVFLAWALF